MSWLIFLCETLMRLYRQKKKICARMPVYCVLFRSKFSTVSGFMINCLLTEFGWAGRENIWLSVIKQGPRCAPTTQSISTQYFGFVRHTFIAHCNWTWKMKSFILFLMGNVKLKCWVTVQPKFLSLNGNLSLRDNRLLVFVNFSFSSGGDLHDRSQNC